jgi:uncharacterized phage protein (TIGR02218 family)
VDNAEANSLSPIAGFEIEGVSQEEIDAGALDKVPFVLYEINYDDLTSGRHEIIAGGTIGEIRQKVGGLTVLELRSLSQQLKQTVGRLYGLKCSAKFGSQPIGTGGGVVEERFPCGFDLSPLWVGMTVTFVDSDEPELVFADSTLPQDDDYFRYGVARCTGGANLGITREIEGFASGQIVLQFPFPYPVGVGDTFDIRPGCSKLHQGANSCRTWWGEYDWRDHFRGYPHMPVAEATKLLVPGAALTGRYSGTGEETSVVTPPTDTGGTPTQPGDTDPSTSRTRGATVITVPSGYADGADATSRINTFIATLPVDGGTVVFPDGTFLVNTITSIQPGNNVWLKLSAGTILKAIYTTTDHTGIISLNGYSNVEISGGILEGFRDQYVPLSGTTSEWNHAIEAFNCQHVTIRDITLRKNTGDGISMGGTTDDIILDNVLSDNNRRQGLSIVHATNVLVTDSIFRNTHGTSPECGIDIEPENGDTCQHITIQNCKFETNAKYGINILKRSGVTATLDDITITGCTIGGSTSAGNLSNGIVTNSASNVTVADCTISYNRATGLRSSNTTNLTVTGNTFAHNYTQNGIDSTDTAHLIATGLNSPQTDPHVLIPAPASGQSITNNTFYY